MCGGKKTRREMRESETLSGPHTQWTSSIRRIEPISKGLSDAIPFHPYTSCPSLLSILKLSSMRARTQPLASRSSSPKSHALLSPPPLFAPPPPTPTTAVRFIPSRVLPPSGNEVRNDPFKITCSLNYTKNLQLSASLSTMPVCAREKSCKITWKR